MNGKHTGSKPLNTKEEELAICNYYWTRQPTGYYPSYKETALEFNCTGGHVRNMLKKHNFPRRTQSETREHRPCKPTNQPDGPQPLCACGCGTPVEWVSNARAWRKYAKGHYQPQKPYHDREWLEREYHGKGRSIAEIAAQFSVNKTVIRDAMRVRGIKSRTTKESLILRGSASGPKNPAWKGGVAEWDYSPDWKRICKQIKDRDKWTCQHCGEQRKRWGAHLHVHHKDGDKLNNSPDNLISLCAKCHRIAHSASVKNSLLE